VSIAHDFQGQAAPVCHALVKKARLRIVIFTGVVKLFSLIIDD
jgi:hypothetical protein